MRRFVSIGAGLGVSIALGIASSSTAAETVVERLIAAQNPCSNLKADTPIGKIGINYLDAVRLQTAKVALDGDAVTLSLKGSLACRTSDQATFRGKASVAIDANAHGSLSSCQLDVDVNLSEFDGLYGRALGAAKSLLETELESLLRREAATACEKFKAAN